MPSSSVMIALFKPWKPKERWADEQEPVCHGRSVSSDMPGVTELAQRFERSSRSDSGDTGRTTPKAPPRVVVISKPGPEFVYSSDESKVRRVERPTYSPSDQKSVLSTTVVDIEPPGFRTVQPHYVEERYQLEEQYRSVKSYTGPKKEGYVKPREVVIPTVEKRETKESAKETVTGHTVFSSRTEQRSSPTDQQREPEIEEIRGATPVRSVVEQFESRIEEERKTPERRPYQYKEKIEEITTHEKRPSLPEREVFIPRSDLLPSRKTYTESITTSRKLSGSDREQPYRGRREITREEVTRVPPYNGLRETLTEEVSRGHPYTETREVRREEVERSLTDSEEYRRRTPPERERVVPVEKMENVQKEDVTMETMTTESVRTFPRVVVPKQRSPTPPRAVKSTLEIAKEEYKEEKKQPEKPPRDFRETLTERSERTERTETMETTETYKRTGKVEDTTRTPASTPVPPLRPVTVSRYFWLEVSPSLKNLI
ncbi:unnamed protein product [Strongylus vulgaris]|uniref:Uncharacterized protein n=1 Tax=Strongylus vulgaris TaxID=40348 RepID=A0A3P7L620_STRVU|nr:unnamed protein product [Strongylus vulgaris]